MTDESAANATHQEYVVVDRSGRLQIPAEYLRALGIDDRAVIRLEDGRIVVEPVPVASTRARA
jgi:bifunctional DNA-binding transcriptional regulator/antitoxin component of YhaV-PrlF toxin-antitoxin module